MIFYVVRIDCRVPGLRNGKRIVKATDKRVGRCESLVHKNAEQFFCKRLLLYAVKMIQARKRSPANIHCGKYICLCVIHDLAKFVPIVDLFKWDLFDWRTCDNHSVKFLREGFFGSDVKFL